jgi:hypothetical protein
MNTVKNVGLITRKGSKTKFNGNVNIIFVYGAIALRKQ